MEHSITLQKFIEALRSAGTPLPPARFLADASGAWTSLSLDARAAILANIGLTDVDAGEVALRVGKVNEGGSTLANVRVILEWGPEPDARDDEHEGADAGAASTSDLPEAPAEPESDRATDPLVAGHDHDPDGVADVPLAEPLSADPLDAMDVENEAPVADAPPMAHVLHDAEDALASVAGHAPESPEDDPPAEADETSTFGEAALHDEDATDESATFLETEEIPGATLPFDDALAQTDADEGETFDLAVIPEDDADFPVETEESAMVADSPETTSPPVAAGTVEDEDAPEGEVEAEEPIVKTGLFGRLFKQKATEIVDESDEPITPIPPVEAPLREIEVYPIQDPYVFVRILYDDSTHEHIYETLEPSLSDRESNILEFVEDTIVDVIEVGLGKLGLKDAAELLTKSIDEIIFDYSIVLSPRSKEKIVYYILRNFLGFGKLDPMMRDTEIEDISCDGPNIPLFVYTRKYESVKSNVMFEDHDEADSFVIRLAQRSGKHISIAEPLLDATLPDGSRLNATLSHEVTAKGSTFTIRKFKPDPFTPPDLVRFGTMNSDILAYWWLAVQNGASAIYAGGTASGKTTSLNAILLFIPPQMKIVSIEDTREVNLPHPNWIPGVTRSGFGPRDSHGRQAGEIDMFTLLKAALRQRPEYILVGEVRGAEAYALFQAMATGHTAYGTMHADSTESVIHRLESAPISIPRSLLEALDIVSIQIQTRIGERRVRRTKELVEIVGLDPHTREILTNEVFSWNPSDDTFEFSGVSYVLERIQMERNLSATDMKLEFEDRKLVIQWLIDQEITDYLEVAHVIQRYYKEKAKLMEEVKRDTADAAAAKAEAEAGAASEDAGEDAEFDASPPPVDDILESGEVPALGAGDARDDDFEDDGFPSPEEDAYTPTHDAYPGEDPTSEDDADVPKDTMDLEDERGA